MTKPTANTLPLVPSELLEVALGDLEKVEQSDDYVVNMSHWHSPSQYGQCRVCLAGAVMAGTLGVDPNEDKSPSDHPSSQYGLLLSLDVARSYDWDSFFDLIKPAHTFAGLTPPVLTDELREELPDIYNTRYEEDRAAWKRNMRKAVRVLKERGM